MELGVNEILAEPPLVGRKNELETLQRHLDLATQGKGTTVFISGEAGSGKTRLVNELLISSKQKRELNELMGWCLSNSGVPYFPFIEAFKIYSSDTHSSDEEMGLKVWLMGPRKSEKSREFESLSPQAWKDSTFAAVTQFLFSISVKKPTVLFIDDLHWADTASLALLNYISRFVASEKVLVLATFRSEDLNPDSEGRPHPLVDALRLMGRENLFDEIKLSVLSHSDTSLLAEKMIGGRVQTELGEKLANESQGNPLFIVESLKMLSENGSLVQQNNRWRLSTSEIGIPTKIKDILRRRVDLLKPNQRKVLEIASVIGSKFEPELLGAIAAQDNLEILETLDIIEKSTALVVCEGNYYKFDHVKYCDALYEEISPLLRKAYHSKVAVNLESNWINLNKGKLPIADLAFHYTQAGNKKKAVKYGLAAGEEALNIFNGTGAIKHFNNVLDLTANDVTFANERITALEGLGDGLYTKARCGEAAKVYKQLSGSVASSLVKLRATRKAINAVLAQGDYYNALEIANKALENPEFDRLEYARMLAAKGKIAVWGAKFTKGLEDLKKALKVVEEEYSLSDMTVILQEMAPAYLSNGQPENAIATGLRSRSLSEYSTDLDRGSAAYFYLCVVLLGCKLEEEGLEAIAEAAKVGEKISDPLSRAWAQSLSYFMSSQFLEAKAAEKLFSGLPLESMQSFGRVAKIKFFMSSLISGSLREFKKGLKTAIDQALKGAECAEESDSYMVRIFNYGNLTRQYATIGDKDQAEKYYQKLVEASEKAPRAGGLAGWGQVLLSKASYFSSLGQWKEANQLYEETLNAYTSDATENAMSAGVRQGYCWVLLQQGRFEEAKMQFEKAKETLESYEKRFVHSNVLGYFMAPRRVEINKEFNMRLDLINVAKNSGVLVSVDGLVPVEFKVVGMQPNYKLQNGSVEFEKKRINPFTDEALTFTVQATKSGEFTLNPQLTYIDDLGETKTCKIDPVNINVRPALAS